MPGEELPKSLLTPSGDSGSGLQQTNAPLPYLRSRNALKIILDLDLGFGRVKPEDRKAASRGVLGALGIKSDK